MALQRSNRHIHRLLRIGQSRGRECHIRNDADTRTGRILQLVVTQIGARTRLLRASHLLVVLVSYTLHIVTDVGCALSIGVVLHLATTVVLHNVVGGRQLHAHAIAEHIGNLRLSRSRHSLLDTNLALAIDGVGDTHRRLDILHLILGHSLRHISLNLRIERLEHNGGVAPYAVAGVQMSTYIVLGRSTPEVGTQSRIVGHDRLATVLNLVDETLAVEANRPVVARHLRRFLKLGNLHGALR